MVKKFLRSETVRFMRLGKRRQKLQKWRKPRGRHNKIRKKRAGYPATPSIGYGTHKKLIGLVEGMRPVMITNMLDVTSMPHASIGVLSRRIGAKKRMEIIKVAHEKKIKLLNVKGDKK